MIPPKYLCLRHLLGEHVECHMFAGTIKKGISVQGYIANGLLNMGDVGTRHNELANELIARGYKHNSPIHYFPFCRNINSVDIEESYRELIKRCDECKSRISADFQIVGINSKEAPGIPTIYTNELV